MSAVADSLTRFNLEDFFDEFEHLPGLINLASSDAQPWSGKDLQAKDVTLRSDHLTMAYPDAKTHLLPGLRLLCNPPMGIDLLATSGAAEGIALIMHELSTTTAHGRNKLIGVPRPSYGAFSGLATLLGLHCEFYDYDPSRGWAPDPAQVLALAKRCNALIVTNPHNPTGNVMPMPELEQVNTALRSHGGTLIVDEVFRAPGETESSITLGENVVVIGSLSKTYGLPGLRLGWVATSQERLRRLRTVQQYLTLSLSAMTVIIGAAVLKKPELFSRAELIHANRTIVTDWAGAHEDVVRISVPAGGTTVCVVIDTTMDETALFDSFVQRGVLLAPGSRCFEFARDLHWFRLGYGTESETLHRGLELVAAAIDRIGSR
ncbi:MAG TPA: pyridoxal phosphate-dependent aminotransferase [Gemmatimonadaceae bacterium]|nr:pyridoxal phosphate-dependent aminotransferase [Gemmatimonadaceae bacterium]